MYNYATKNYRKTTVRTTHVLHKTNDRTTQNYRPYYTKLQTILHKTTDHTTQNNAILQTNYLHVYATDTNQVSCTQIRHNDVASYILSTHKANLMYTRNVHCAVAFG